MAAHIRRQVSTRGSGLGSQGRAGQEQACNTALGPGRELQPKRGEAGPPQPVFLQQFLAELSELRLHHCAAAHRWPRAQAGQLQGGGELAPDLTLKQNLFFSTEQPYFAFLLKQSLKI